MPTRLGAVLLLTAYCAIAPGGYERRERARLAACHFVDPLRVEIAGHVLDLPAGFGSFVRLKTDGTLHGKATTTRREQRAASGTRSNGFCLDAPQDAPLAVRLLQVAFKEAVALTTQVGLPRSDATSLRLREAEMFSRDTPAPVGSGTRLRVYRRNAENDWVYVVTEGFTSEGFRLAAWCRPTHDGRQSCRVHTQDTIAVLSYTLDPVWIDDREFDGAPVPAEFLDVAREIRALVALLEAEAAD